jgi:regulator of sigma E protease
VIGFLYSVLGFIVAIGMLTTVHEYGHFSAARFLGVKVLRFSIGFGKALVSWHGNSGTEYVIAAMLDQNEGIVPPNELHRAFNNKPIWVRMLIIAAGPCFNLMFAVIAYWCVFMLGISSIVPIIGDVPHGSVAAIAGLKSGQEIVAVNDHPVQTWEDISIALISNVGDAPFINIQVEDQHSKKKSVHALNLANWSLNDNDERIIKNLGLEPLDPIPPIVGKTMPDLPAAKAGLLPGDQILSVDGVAVASRSAMLHALKDKYDRGVHLVVKRSVNKLTVLITPEKKILDGGEASGFIGIQFQDLPWPSNLLRTQHYAPMVAFSMGLERTKEYSVLTLQFLRKMLIGQMSLQHVAGPISIAKFAGRTASSGLEQYLGFLALVSISLGVLNMLPIPILDGGHFLYCLIELVGGKALSTRALGIGNAMGFVVLGSFMLLAMFNDIVRIFQ